jgi:hypothetical protein
MPASSNQYDMERKKAETHRRRIVGDLPLGLGVDADHLALVPDLVDQLVQIPAVLGRNGHAVGQPTDDIELFDRDLIDLVQDIDGGHVLESGWGGGQGKGEGK